MGSQLRKWGSCLSKLSLNLRLTPRVIFSLLCKCCVGEALRSAPGAVGIFLYRWTISMVATYIQRKFLSTPDASSTSCLCSSSMTSNLQHVSGLCSMSSPDAVPSLSSIPVPCTAMMNYSCHGANLRHIHALQRPLQDEGTSLHAKSFHTLLYHLSSRSLGTHSFVLFPKKAKRSAT